MSESTHTHSEDTSPRQVAPNELELVRRFVNTLDLEQNSDELADPESTAAWLKQNELLHPDEAPLRRSDRDRVVAVREALRSLLRTHGGASQDPAAVEVLDHASRRGPLRVRFSTDEGIRLAAEATGVDGALARLFAIVHIAQIDGSWPLLKICGNDTCQWAFFDHSKNHSGVWCSMAVCGNRMKARAYRERKAKAS